MSTSINIGAESFFKWGRAAITAAFVCALLLIFAIMWMAPEVVVWTPLAVLGGVAMFFVLRDPALNLAVLIGSYALIAQYSHETSALDVLYALYFFSFIGWWFISRVFIYDRRIVEDYVDAALLAFFGYVAFSLTFTVAHEVIAAEVVSEFVSLSMFLLYFPVKEACKSSDRSFRYVLYGVAILALAIVFRNFYLYYERLSAATALWQIMVGRIPTNEHVLLMASVGILPFYLNAKTFVTRQALFGVFALLTAGVVIGLSRAVWVSYILGILAVFWVSGTRERIRTAVVLGGGFLLVFGVGWFAFQDVLLFILAGLIDRLVTLGTATTEDISLVNRFVENEAVWEAILANPVTGYGLGAIYTYDSLVYLQTYETTFVHNTYLGLWYRFGIVGIILLGLVYVTSLWRGYRLSKAGDRTDVLYRLVGTGALAALIAESLVAHTENIFMTSDKILMFAVIFALTAASWHHSQNQQVTVIKRTGS